MIPRGSQTSGTMEDVRPNHLQLKTGGLHRSSSIQLCSVKNSSAEMLNPFAKKSKNFQCKVISERPDAGLILGLQEHCNVRMTGGP